MNPNQPASELREALAALNPYFRRALWFGLVSSLLMLVPSAYMLEVYDRVVNSRSHMTLAMLTVLVLAAYALMEVLEWVRAEVMREASRVFDERMSARVFTAIFEASLKRQPGGSPQAMLDLRTLRDFLYAPVLLALMEAPVSLLILVLLFAISPVLGWTSLVAAVLQVFVGWRNERSTQPPLLAANRSASAAQQYADSSLRNAQVIEAMGMLTDIHHRWLNRQREFLSQQAKASLQAGIYQAASKFLQTTVSSLLLGLGAWLLLHNQLAGGGGYMIVGSILGGRVLAPLVQIVMQWQLVVTARDAYDRLNAVLTAVPPRQPSMALPAPKGALQVDALVAGAPGSAVSILKGVSFALAPGEVLAVVGPSAAGKTTLARLLVGVWPAMSGKVRLNGADVYTWDKSELGPHVGYLPQGVELLDGSVADNIARFGKVDQAQLEAAARAVGLHELIEAMPQGYASPVGREGAVLSGGQRQRLGLARALYGRPALVVLDEPNSSLDEQGDAALASAIGQMKAGGTTFVVMTHRTSVLAVADKVLMLRDGQTQMVGPRDEVMKALAEAVAKARAGTGPGPGSAAAPVPG
jgi:ATP-binding cassette subfamily C exporter for protease/lipase